MLITIILLWAFFGPLNAGAWYAYAQREYPGIAEMDRRDDTFAAVLFGLSGPFGFLPVMSGTDMYRHGFKIPGTR
jgi:hypothetical protein